MGSKSRSNRVSSIIAFSSVAKNAIHASDATLFLIYKFKIKRSMYIVLR